jgi:hypothetical protein
VGFGLVTEFTEQSQFLITIHYDAIVNSHSLQFLTHALDLLGLLCLTSPLLPALAMDVPLLGFPNCPRATTTATFGSHCTELELLRAGSTARA